MNNFAQGNDFRLIGPPGQEEIYVANRRIGYINGYVLYCSNGSVFHQAEDRDELEDKMLEFVKNQAAYAQACASQPTLWQRFLSFWGNRNTPCGTKDAEFTCLLSEAYPYCPASLQDKVESIRIRGQD